jgi:hypothetical protein
VSWSLSYRDTIIIVFRSIDDSDGPTIADTFYEELFKLNTSTDMAATSAPDTTQAAQALRIAVAKLRSTNASFARWVPFIHLGQ